MTTKEKTFDAVAFQRKRRKEMDIQSGSKSFQERKNLIKSAAERFRSRIKGIRAKKTN
ncbi:MAG TPA: hypothetical protein P5280_02990 [Cyclobacteriaceae bacterium]|nr:hypothetical protein [Cyclobacteriaceae bacterium]